MKNTQERKDLMAIKFKLLRIDENLNTIQYVVDDLPDEYLQNHFDRAMISNDFEYAHAVATEMNIRNLIILFN